MAEELYGYAGSGLFGYSHMMGGYAGGQAQYVRVPFADVGPMKVPDHLADEQVLFLTDIFPTGYMAAENCNIQPGDIVAVWGCGPVGQMAIAQRVDARRRAGHRHRLRAGAAADGGASSARSRRSNFEKDDVFDRLKQLTAGAVPTRASTRSASRRTARRSTPTTTGVKTAAFLATDRPTALRQAIHACRKGGMVSIPGVYGGFLDKMPFGAAFGKGLTFKMGQTHVMKYLQAAARAHRARRDRSVVRHHAPPAARRGGRRLQDVPRQARTSASRSC